MGHSLPLRSPRETFNGTFTPFDETLNQGAAAPGPWGRRVREGLGRPGIAYAESRSAPCRDPVQGFLCLINKALFLLPFEGTYRDASGPEKARASPL